MSNYTQTTQFGPKDLLPRGDPAKKIRGAEIDVELGNIQTAVNSKADSAHPAFSGTATGSLTWANAQIFQGDNTFTGSNTFHAGNTFIANNLFAGSNTYTGANTFDATVVFNALNRFSDRNIFEGNVTFRAKINFASAVGGTGDAMTLTFDPPFVGYADGQIFIARAPGNNTSSTPTVNVDGLGLVEIVKENNRPLAPDDIQAGLEMVLLYNSSIHKMTLLNPAKERVRSRAVFTSSGTWNRPPHVRFVRVCVVGSGGGGGIGESSGASGGAGGYGEAIIDVAGVSSVPVTIGDGGFGGTNGGTGGTCSFGSFVSCTGGTGGATSPPSPGSGGTASFNGTLFAFGITGQEGSTISTNFGDVKPNGGVSPLGRVGAGGSAGQPGYPGIVIVEEI